MPFSNYPLTHVLTPCRVSKVKGYFMMNSKPVYLADAAKKGRKPWLVGQEAYKPVIHPWIYCISKQPDKACVK